MNGIPLYLFTGFLEAGKTKFIQDTMVDAEFNAGEPTLILLCEEGEEEFDMSLWADKGEHTTIHVVEREDWFTEDRLNALVKRSKAERVIVEYNGMWQLDTLYQHLPETWNVAQELFICDSTTIMAYNANMRQQVVDKLQSASVAIFNRVTPNTDKDALHKLVRAVSRRAQIAYEHTDGSLEYDQIVDPLPFDKEAPVIDIADKDYALWYRDISEEMDSYQGKVVRFLGIVAKNPQMNKTEFAIGRHVMVCCEADIAYRAFLATYEKAPSLSSYDWVRVTAKIEIKRTAFYGDKGPTLTIMSLEKAEKPEQEVATFY